MTDQTNQEQNDQEIITQADGSRISKAEYKEGVRRQALRDRAVAEANQRARENWQNRGQLFEEFLRKYVGDAPADQFQQVVKQLPDAPVEALFISCVMHTIAPLEVNEDFDTNVLP